MSYNIFYKGKWIDQSWNSKLEIRYPWRLVPSIWSFFENLPYEVDVIKSIPIISRLPANKLIWAESPNVHYSVRSVYAVAARLSHPGNFSATSDNSQNQHFWKQIWSLPLPHKIRHFAWRVCRNILPTKVNLMKRKVIQDDICASV